MSRGLRILHIADTHIGAQLVARPRRHGQPSRGDDFVRSYQLALARAEEFDVDLVIHAGDVFDEPSPSGAAMAAAGMPLLGLAARGVPVVIIPGNHERCVLPGSLLFSHENLHVLDRPGVRRFDLRGARVAIAGLPCIRRGSAARFAGEVAATGWSANEADIHILVAHQSFESAVCGPGTFRFKTGDDVVERDQIPAGFQYVAAGHIHRHQTLMGPLGAGGPVVYAGSTDRITFAEQREPKGCVLIEASKGGLGWRFVEHAVRPMASLPLDVSGLSREAIREAVLAWAMSLPADCLAQARLSGRTEPRHMRGLGLREIVAEKRPDVLFSSSGQAVQFAPTRDLDREDHCSRAVAQGEHLEPARDFRPCEAATVKGAVRSAFDVLAQDGRMRDPDWARVEATPETLATLPRGAGTYAMFDAGGRLLYVGKAVDTRTRVRTHLRRPDASAFFAGWTQRIARIEVRPAGGELEALLVEAELIRRWRPPFNREMRSWSRYCYLIEQDGPLSPLGICTDWDEELRCYGPYRSRFTAAEIIDEVCAATGLPACPDEEESRSRQRSRVARQRSASRERGAAREQGVGMFATAGGTAAAALRSLTVARRDAGRMATDGCEAMRVPARAVCDRYYGGQCGGQCAGHVSSRDDLAARVRRRRLLLGQAEAESMVVAVERAAEDWALRSEAERAIAEHSGPSRASVARARMLARRAAILRAAWEHGRMLTEAAELLGQAFEIGEGPGAIRVRLGPRGLMLGEAADDRSAAAAVPRFVPRELLDGLLTVVRGRRREEAGTVAELE